MSKEVLISILGEVGFPHFDWHWNDVVKWYKCTSPNGNSLWEMNVAINNELDFDAEPESHVVISVHLPTLDDSIAMSSDLGGQDFGLLCDFFFSLGDPELVENLRCKLKEIAEFLRGLEDRHG